MLLWYATKQSACSCDVTAVMSTVPQFKATVFAPRDAAKSSSASSWKASDAAAQPSARFAAAGAAAEDCAGRAGG